MSAALALLTDKMDPMYYTSKWLSESHDEDDEDNEEEDEDDEDDEDDEEDEDDKDNENEDDEDDWAKYKQFKYHWVFFTSGKLDILDKDQWVKWKVVYIKSIYNKKGLLTYGGGHFPSLCEIFDDEFWAYFVETTPNTM